MRSSSNRYFNELIGIPWSSPCVDLNWIKSILGDIPERTRSAIRSCGEYFNQETLEIFGIYLARSSQTLLNRSFPSLCQAISVLLIPDSRRTKMSFILVISALQPSITFPLRHVNRKVSSSSIWNMPFYRLSQFIGCSTFEGFSELIFEASELLHKKWHYQSGARLNIKMSSYQYTVYRVLTTVLSLQ